MSPERFTSLLESARQGSEAAWQELYDGLAPVVLGYLRANSAPDPEDVLSEVFLQVARDIATFDGEEKGFRSWVFTIAHHRLIDARRHSARRPVDLAAEPPAFECAGGPVWPDRRGGVRSFRPIALPRLCPIALPRAF